MAIPWTTRGSLCTCQALSSLNLGLGFDISKSSSQILLKWNWKITQDLGVIFIQTSEHQGDEQKNIWEGPSGVNPGEVRGCPGSQRGSFVQKLLPACLLLISHRIKLSGPVDTEPKTIRVKMDRLVFSGHLNSYHFSTSRVISFARGVRLLQKSTRMKLFPTDPQSGGKLSLFSYALDSSLAARYKPRS